MSELETKLNEFAEENQKLYHELKDLSKRNAEDIKKIKDGKAPSAEFERKLDALENMQGGFQDLEKKTTELQAKLQQENEHKVKLEEKLKDLETKAARGFTGSKARLSKQDFEIKGLYRWYSQDPTGEMAEKTWDCIRSGVPYANLTPEEKALTLSDPETGGYLAPPEFVNELAKEMRELTPVMKLARVRTTTQTAMIFPKQTGTITAVRRGESESKSETTGLGFGADQTQLPELYTYVDISHQDLEDPVFDMEAVIREEFADAYAAKIGTEFVSGTGSSNQGEGITTDATIQAAYLASGAASTMKADSFVQFVETHLKQQYWANAQLLFNRTTLGKIRTLADSNGNFYWTPGFGAMPNTICGKPYTISEDMPNIGAGAYPVAIGDFKKGYMLGIRIKQQISRITDSTLDAAGQVRISGRMRARGMIVQTNAIKVYKIAAS